MGGSTNIATTFFAELSAGRVDAALALTSDDFTWRVAGKAGGFPLSGSYDRAQYLEMLTRVGQAFSAGPDIKITSVTSGSDRIVLEGHVTGLSTAGLSYDNDLVYVFELAGGLISEVREYLDTIHADEVFAL